MKPAFGGGYIILTLLSTLALTVKHEAQPVQIKPPIVIEQLQPKKIETPNFDIEVLTPLRAAQAAKQAELDKLAAEEAERLRQAEEARQEALVTYTPQTYVQSYGSGTLIAGTYGYARAGGNCVLEPGVNNPGFGNPISWPITSRTPRLGATVLFYFNHVAVLTGIYSNGDIEVRHQNMSGNVTRYSMSQVRGFR